MDPMLPMQQNQPINQIDESIRYRTNNLQINNSSIDLLLHRVPKYITSSLALVDEMLQNTDHAFVSHCQPQQVDPASLVEMQLQHFYRSGHCIWPLCSRPCNSMQQFLSHINSQHVLINHTFSAQMELQAQVIHQLVWKITEECRRMDAMRCHLMYNSGNIEGPDNDGATKPGKNNNKNNNENSNHHHNNRKNKNIINNINNSNSINHAQFLHSPTERSSPSLTSCNSVSSMLIFSHESLRPSEFSVEAAQQKEMPSRPLSHPALTMIDGGYSSTGDNLVCGTRCHQFQPAWSCINLVASIGQPIADVDAEESSIGVVNQSISGQSRAQRYGKTAVTVSLSQPCISTSVSIKGPQLFVAQRKFRKQHQRTRNQEILKSDRSIDTNIMSSDLKIPSSSLKNSQSKHIKAKLTKSCDLATKLKLRKHLALMRSLREAKESQALFTRKRSMTSTSTYSLAAPIETGIEQDIFSSTSTETIDDVGPPFDSIVSADADIYADCRVPENSESKPGLTGCASSTIIAGTSAYNSGTKTTSLCQGYKRPDPDAIARLRMLGARIFGQNNTAGDEESHTRIGSLKSANHIAGTSAARHRNKKEIARQRWKIQKRSPKQDIDTPDTIAEEEHMFLQESISSQNGSWNETAAYSCQQLQLQEPDVVMVSASPDSVRRPSVIVAANASNSANQGEAKMTRQPVTASRFYHMNNDDVYSCSTDNAVQNEGQNVANDIDLPRMQCVYGFGSQIANDMTAGTAVSCGHWCCAVNQKKQPIRPCNVLQYALNL